MKNIREEKGLTYGIFSALINMINGDYLMIGSDVKRENTQLVEDEIIREIKILQTERVSEEELQKVKNYMSGSFVMSFNNAFAIADKFKEAHLHGLDYSYYNDYLHALNQTTAEDIVLMANQYFNIVKMQTVIAGGKS
jgi:predicted Zn-dependent peptidase